MMEHRALALLLLIAASFSAPAVEIHAPMCLYGCPAGGPETNDILFREIYVLSSNDSTKFADWAAYRVTAETIGPSPDRVWRADPWLADEETLEPDDYRGAHASLHTDRGHQVPLASFAGTPYWAATNYLSNITPQRSDLNQGPWKHLEASVRDLAQSGPVYVMTGPLFEGETAVLPEADEKEPVHIPSGYWKIVATESGGSVSAAAFIFQQDTPRSADYCAQEYGVIIDMVEERTKLDFFPDLPAEQEKVLEESIGGLRGALGCAP